MSAFGAHVIVSVEAVPVAEVVTTVAQAFAEIELVPSDEVPLAIVIVSVESAFGSVNVFSLVVGPVNFVKPFAVPPKAEPIICVNAAEPSKLLP